MGRKHAVKSRWRSKETPETAGVVELLERTFPNHPAEWPHAAYRYNSASIRVRMVDEMFRGKSLPERDKIVAPTLEQLPEETLSDITLLLLLAPEEVDDSPANFEFEYAASSRI